MTDNSEYEQKVREACGHLRRLMKMAHETKLRGAISIRVTRDGHEFGVVTTTVEKKHSLSPV